MSGLKKCTKQSKTPYYISEIDLNIYSLEEICYFLYNHIYLVEKSFFNENLSKYIESHLGKAAIAKKMNDLLEAKAPIEEFMLLFFYETMYYDDAEIKKIQPLLGKLEKKGRQERMQMKAESFFYNGKYEKALNIYLKILMTNYDYSLSVDFYANIYYSIGVIYAKFFVYDKAEDSFERAFKISPMLKYLKNMVIISLIQKDEEHLLDLIRKYNIPDEVLSEANEEYNALVEEVDSEKIKNINIEEYKQEYVEMLIY